jgi:23S rRNA pseudouridine955/2504/2580 synthase
MISIEVPEAEEGSRIDRCIRRILGNVNQAILEKHLRAGLILLENKKIKSSTKVSFGETIKYSSNIDFKSKIVKKYLNKETEKYYKKLYKQIFIKQTNDYIAINKPPGLAVQGGSSQKFHVDDMLKYIFKNQNKPKLVHRIDKDTSGLLIIARDQTTAKKMSMFFKDRHIIKTYLAIVSPCPKLDSGLIDAPIVKSGVEGNKRMIIDFYKGKLSQSEYKVLDKVGSRVALLALSPKTGRTHQLRVHLEYINAPIVGDKKYKGLSGIYSSNKNLKDHDNISQIRWDTEDINNLQLHAYSIQMPTNEVIEAELDIEFKKNLQFLGLTLPKNINKIFL